MAEYIDREKLMEKFCWHCEATACGDDECFYKRVMYSIPASDVQPVKWISVTERLPEEYKDVLCYYEYFRFGDFNCMFRTIDRGYYGNGIWGGEAGQGYKNKVLAWMPLPEPPKEE